jgi:hypothetical protein
MQLQNMLLLLLFVAVQPSALMGAWELYRYARTHTAHKETVT